MKNSVFPISATYALTLFASLHASPKIIESEFANFGSEFNPSQNAADPQKIAATFQIAPKPFNPAEFEYFANAFSLSPASARLADESIRSVATGGKTLLYMENKSEIFFSDASAADMDKSDTMSDFEKKGMSLKILMRLLGKEAEGYVFVNDEKNFMQESAGAEPVEIAYYARYAKVIEGRPVLGNQFQIRIGIGHRGCLKEFSFRDPVFHSRKVRNSSPPGLLPERLRGAIIARPIRETPTGPILISACKPYKRFPAYIVDGVPGTEQLLPVTSFLAENTLEPISLKIGGSDGSEGTYVEHYNIPDIGQ
jgi:hypothetical protein